jgi:hypothetical protein
MKIEANVVIDNKVDHEAVSVSKVITKDADIRVVLGEVLYAAEINCHKFSTSDAFQAMIAKVEEKFKAGKGYTRLKLPYKNGEVMLKVAITQ